MRKALLVALALVALALPAVAVSSSGASGAEARYVFAFKTGLVKARIGAKTTTYQALFSKAVRLPNVGGGICFGLAYAVSSDAQKARTADLELSCGDKPLITEMRFASKSFCSASGTCVGTPGSLKKFAAELKGGAATVTSGMECADGRSGCTTIDVDYGGVQVSVRSSNCRTFASLAAIGPKCIAADVLIYRLD